MEAKYEAKIIQKSFFIPFQSSGMNEWAPWIKGLSMQNFVAAKSELLDYRVNQSMFKTFTNALLTSKCKMRLIHDNQQLFELQ